MLLNYPEGIVWYAPGVGECLSPRTGEPIESCVVLSSPTVPEIIMRCVEWRTLGRLDALDTNSLFSTSRSASSPNAAPVNQCVATASWARLSAASAGRRSSLTMAEVVSKAPCMQIPPWSGRGDLFSLPGLFFVAHKKTSFYRGENCLLFFLGGEDCLFSGSMDPPTAKLRNPWSPYMRQYLFVPTSDFHLQEIFIYIHWPTV